jgi:NADH-quinone oxidoreductase subunit J
MTAFLFWLIAGVTGVCAIMVLVTQNIVRAAAWLLFTLAGTSAIFFLLGADFVGATQLIVYVGGTLVLVVFGVMLTAQGPFVSMRAGAAEWAGTILVGLLLMGALSATIWFSDWTEYPAEPLNVATSPSAVQLGQSFLGVTDAMPVAPISGIPQRSDGKSDKAPPVLYRKQVAYLLPFEIVSVHLLVVLIGAAYLARAKRRRIKLAQAVAPPPESNGGPE